MADRENWKMNDDETHTNREINWFEYREVIGKNALKRAGKKWIRPF